MILGHSLNRLLSRLNAGDSGPGGGGDSSGDDDGMTGYGGYGGLGIGNPGSYGGKNDNDIGGITGGDDNDGMTGYGGYAGLGIGNPGSYGGITDAGLAYGAPERSGVDLGGGLALGALQGGYIGSMADLKAPTFTDKIVGFFDPFSSIDYEDMTPGLATALALKDPSTWSGYTVGDTLESQLSQAVVGTHAVEIGTPEYDKAVEQARDLAKELGLKDLYSFNKDVNTTAIPGALDLGAKMMGLPAPSTMGKLAAGLQAVFNDPAGMAMPDKAESKNEGSSV